MLGLNIKPIPANFVTKDWVPAKLVTLQQSWSQDLPYEVGKPITRTIRLNAVGLLETQLPDLAPTEPGNAKVYQDKTDTITRVNGDQFVANKTIKYAVIPNQEGTLEIPELTLEWYNTEKKQAEVARIPATTLTIQAAAPGTLGAPNRIDFSPPATQATPPESPTSTSAVDSAQLRWWQIGTVGFALLWLATLLLFWLKPRPKADVQTNAASTPPPSIRGINQATPSEVQSKILY